MRREWGFSPRSLRVQPGSSLRFHGALCLTPRSSPLSAVIISPCLYVGYPVPVIPQPEVLRSGAYSPIAVWTTASPFHAPLPAGLSPLSGYPASLGRVSPPPPSDTSSKDHSGSESPISDEEERLQSKLSDPHAIEAEKFQCNLCNKI